ncbi:MAG TPA: DUF4412 domain-containing protein [Sulfurovum sp.]|uniref:DUF4412 domain-containing protein n=1 Tax=Sulfurovum sp. TaxID=1969726 RepID=UPI002F95DB22
MYQMKLWGMLLAFMLTLSTLHAEEKRYQVRSGMVEYALSSSGNMMGMQTKIEGKSKMLFKEWGNVELRDDTTTSVIMGREEHTRQTTKIDHGKVYIVDYEQKAIIEYDPAALQQSMYKDLAKSAQEMMLSKGGTKTGEEKIKGYECEVWETPQMKLWLHKGIMLRSEVKVMGIVHTTEATAVHLDRAVSDEALQLPDFPIRTMEEHRKNDHGDMPQMTPEQIQQMQEIMKNFTQK